MKRLQNSVENAGLVFRLDMEKEFALIGSLVYGDSQKTVGNHG